MTMFWIWLVAGVVFLIIELLSPSFFFMCFTFGAVVAAIYGYFYPAEYYWQIGLFIIATLAVLPFYRRMAKKILRPSPESNVDALVGRIAVVTEPIDPVTGGKVTLDGELWLASAEEPLERQVQVKVISITGATLHVVRAR